MLRFRERLNELGLVEALFDRFGDDLSAAGFKAKRGRIVDASIVPVPIRRNSCEENRRTIEGEVSREWSAVTRD